MNPIMIQKDIQQLTRDAQRLSDDLHMLEKDHEAWARDREERDVEQLIGRVRRLESDVSLMQSDCICLASAYQDHGSKSILDSLGRAYSALNTLFDDLKKIRSELKDSTIRPDELKQLEIDWGRFRKTSREIGKYLYEGERLRRTRDAFQAKKDRRIISFPSAPKS